MFAASPAVQPAPTASSAGPTSSDPSPGPTTLSATPHTPRSPPAARAFHAALASTLSNQRAFSRAEHLADLAAARAASAAGSPFHAAVFEEGQRLRRGKWEGQGGAVRSVAATLGEAVGVREVEEAIARWLRG